MKKLLQQYIKNAVTGLLIAGFLVGCGSTPRSKGPEIRKASTGTTTDTPLAEAPQDATEKRVVNKKVERIQSSAANVELEIDPKAQQKFNTAMDFMAGERFQDAERILLELNTSNPELSGPYLNLGIIYLEQGLLERAESVLTQAIRANPSNAAAHNQYGIVLRTQGRFVDAQTAYENALVANPNFYNAHLNLGVLHDLYLQQPQSAINHYQQFQDLSGTEDKTVKIWIGDLTRRYGNSRSANASE